MSAYRRQFALGERSLLDVLNAENESLEAELAWNRAWAAQLDSCYRMLHITGRLLDSFRLTLPVNWVPEEVTKSHRQKAHAKAFKEVLSDEHRHIATQPDNGYAGTVFDQRLHVPEAQHHALSTANARSP